MMRKTVNIAAGFFIIMSVVLTFVHPQKPAVRLPVDLNIPIVALELAENKGEVFEIIGEPGNPLREKYFYGTLLDFVYILSYVLAFSLLGVALKREASLQPVQYYVLLLVLGVTGLADALENKYIFDLLKSNPEDDISEKLYWLGRATYLKWGALGLAAGTIASGMARYGKRKVAILFAAAFGASLVGLFYRAAIELHIFALAAAWPWVFVKTLPLKYPWFTENKNDQSNS